MKKIFFVFCILISSFSFSETLKTADFMDQFDVKTNLTETTEWIIFTSDKEVSNMVNKVLEEAKITDLQSLNGLYVSDISKMPGFVTKMFALPKMKKYPFKVTLDKEGTATGSWPREKEKATLLTLKNLEITSTAFTSSAEEIKKFIENKSKPSQEKIESFKK